MDPTRWVGSLLVPCPLMRWERNSHFGAMGTMVELHSLAIPMQRTWCRGVLRLCCFSLPLPVYFYPWHRMGMVGAVPELQLPAGLGGEGWKLGTTQGLLWGSTRDLLWGSERCPHGMGLGTATPPNRVSSQSPGVGENSILHRGQCQNGAGPRGAGHWFWGRDGARGRSWR